MNSYSTGLVSPALEARRRRLHALIRWLADRQRRNVETTTGDALTFLTKSFYLSKPTANAYIAQLIEAGVIRTDEAGRIEVDENAVKELGAYGG